MPITSTQMSGLVGGQMAMFSNQAMLSQQIAGTYGTGPAMGGGMQNPYPTMPSYGMGGGMAGWGQSDVGANIAGGAAKSLPGIAMGVSIAGGVMGGAAGWLDPFTGVGRSALAGSGLGGAYKAGKGFFGTIGKMGGAVRAAGLRGGAGMMMGGAAAALPAMAGYYAAGKAISTVGENLYEGVQNIQDIQGMANQYMPPQFGQGGGVGGGASRGMVKNISSFMHEMASEDVMTSMRDMRQLMDKAGSMGMLTGVMDAASFKDRFRKIVDQTKQVAQILGTSLEEAMPMLGQMQKMGLWTAGDVMGTAIAAKASGPGAAPHMMASMQTGAQISHAMGGRMQAGSLLGKNLFGQVSTAVQEGLLSQQELMEYTGGVGGHAGERMVAGTMQRTMAGFGQSSMGRLMMAGMGEMKDGRFTGRMDEAKLGKFMSGEVDVAQLSREGRGRVRSKESAVSFHNRAAEMGQSMAAQGGMEGMAMAVQQVMEKAGYGDAGEEIQNRIIQQMMKIGTKDADMMQQMMQDAPRLAADRARRLDAAFGDSVRRLDVRRNRSWQGFKDTLGHVFEETVERPIQEFAEGITTRMGEEIDEIGGKLTGRIRQMPQMGSQHRARLAMQTAGQPAVTMQQLGISNRLQDVVNPGGISNALMRMRQTGSFGGVVEGSEGLGLTGGEVSQMSPRAIYLMQQGMKVRKGEAGADEVTLGGGFVAKSVDAERSAQLTMKRAMGRTLVNLDTEEKEKAMGIVKSRIRTLFNSPGSSQSLRDLKESDPNAYNLKLLQRMKGDPEVSKALRTLGKDGEGSDLDKEINAMFDAQTSLGYGGGEHAADARKAASEVGVIIGDRSDIQKVQRESVQELHEVLSGGGGGLAGAASGAWLGAATGASLGLVGQAAGAVIGGLIGLGGLGEDISETQIEQALTSEKYTSVDIINFINQKGDQSDNAFAVAASKGDPNAAKLKTVLEGPKGKEFKDKILQSLGRTTMAQKFELNVDAMERMRTLTKGKGVGAIAGVGAGVTSQIEAIRGKFAGATTVGQTGAASEDITALAKSGALSSGEITKLLRGGGGVVGKQLGREALIQETFAEGEEISEKELARFEKRMGRSGVDMTSGGPARELIDEFMKSDKMIKGDEITKLRKVLEDIAPGAAGRGAAGRTTQDEMLALMTSYKIANRDFVHAVGTAVPALQELKPEVFKKLKEDQGGLDR